MILYQYCRGIGNGGGTVLENPPTPGGITADDIGVVGGIYMRRGRDERENAKLEKKGKISGNEHCGKWVN
jgi:hypothetical protein